jgi:hypothetical protein
MAPRPRKPPDVDERGNADLVERCDELLRAARPVPDRESEIRIHQVTF